MQYLPLYDITPFTALDYPGHLATIFWFAGCNMRCPYCYNPDIVLGEGGISEEKAIDFLQSRIGLLEGVVLSGGEATLYEHLPSFCEKIKEMGFKIKLDTNGSNPEMIKALIDLGLLDFIALDYKAPKQKFLKITKNKHYDQFLMSLKFLIKSKHPFEVRTTVCPDLLTVDDINRIIGDLYQRGYRGKYYLQSYIGDVPQLGRISKQNSVFDKEKVNELLEVIWR